MSTVDPSTGEPAAEEESQFDPSTGEQIGKEEIEPSPEPAEEAGESLADDGTPGAVAPEGEEGGSTA